MSEQLKQKPAAQKQAKPLKLRDAVLVNVALDTLFSVSKIVGIELKYIDWDAKTIFAPKSKTDQSGEGFYG
ncbi:hypothetical protein FX988_04368 (plasmid) [Paraglaciecola mesophila]|uniref:Uncharacterized protein n=1 Tax=Paraglaciecola mesophila TaxID=197222 RepID=A0A857JRK6_9ALTE|nr:hypothetical protein FX988_04368 [Paraglaciecola mesophila]